MDDDLRILVLGDGENPEDIIEYELSKSDLKFIPIRVTTRESFIEALHNFSPHLILLAAGSARINSLTALALAQEICPRAPCFLISPTPCQEQAPEVRESQVDDAQHCVPGVHPETAMASFFAAIITPLVWDKPEASSKRQGALQPLLQIAGVIIAFLSPDGRILEFNRAAERLTGWRRHEILGKDGIELFFPEPDRTLALVHLKEILSGKSAESIDLTLQARDGALLTYRWYCNLVSDKIGQPAGIMLVGQSLSESKLWESQPRARLARCCPSRRASQGRGLITRRTGTC